MENPPTTAPPGQNSSSIPETERLADNLAAKHQGKTAAQPAPAPVNKGGRRTVAEEAADYLAKNGLVAVPANQAGGSAVDPLPPPPVPQYVVTPDFVRECVETLLEGVKDWRVSQVYQRVLRMSKDEPLARELAAQAAPPPGTVKVMGVSACEMAQKHGMVMSWSPEFMFGIASMLWLKGDLALSKRLSELEKGLKHNAAKPPA